MQRIKASITVLVVLTVLLVPAICSASFHPAVKILGCEWEGDKLCVTVQNVSNTNYRAAEVQTFLSTDDGRISRVWYFNDPMQTFKAGEVVTFKSDIGYVENLRIKFLGTDVI